MGGSPLWGGHFLSQGTLPEMSFHSPIIFLFPLRRWLCSVGIFQGGGRGTDFGCAGQTGQQVSEECLAEPLWSQKRKQELRLRSHTDGVQFGLHHY